MRLRSPLDFARVRRQGRRVSGPLLTLSYTQRPDAADTAMAVDAPLTRIGLSVSKRVGDAVRRNLVKRWLRESLRRGYAELAPGWDIIVSARAGAATAGYNALDAETRGLIARARLWRASANRVGADRVGADRG
jgi:ribonuclease P protein component